MYCSLFPRGWYFCGVSNVCSLLYPGCFILQVSCLQRFSLPVVSSVCSLDWMWPLLSRCALVFLWNKTCYHYCQNWGAAKLPGQKTGQVRAWASLLRKEDCHVDWDQYGWNKSSSSSMWWGRALCRQVRWQEFAPPWFPQMVMCLCWGTGEGNSTFQFVPGGDLSMNAALRYILWDEQIISSLCVPGTLQIAVSMLYVHGLFPQLSLQE